MQPMKINSEMGTPRIINVVDVVNSTTIGTVSPDNINSPVCSVLVLVSIFRCLTKHRDNNMKVTLF